MRRRPDPRSDSFARRAGLVAAGQAAVKATQLVLAITLVRLLDPTEWSATAFLLSIYLAGTTIGTLNVQHGIVFFLPRIAPDERASFVRRTMLMLLGVGAVIVAGLVVTAPSFGGRLSDPDDLRWLGLAIALELPAVCVPMTLIAVDRFGRAATWDLVGTAVLLAVTIVPAANGGGTRGVVVGLVLAGAFRSAVGWWQIHALFGGPRRRVRGGVLREQLLYGLPLGATIAVTMLNRLVDKWYIAAFHPNDFGIHAVAAQEVPLLSVLPYAGGTALITSLIAAFKNDDVALARTHWLHLTMTMSSVVVPTAMGLILVAPEVMELVFTPEFDRGVIAFQLFTVVTLHRVVEYGMLLRAAGRTRDLLQVAGVTLLANAVLAGIGAYVGGMTGASLGTLAASAIGWVFVLHKIADILGVRVRHAFAWRAWAGCVTIAAGCATVVHVGTGVPDLSADARLVAKIALFAALFVPALRRWQRSPLSRPPAAIAVPEPPRVLIETAA